LAPPWKEQQDEEETEKPTKFSMQQRLGLRCFKVSTMKPSCEKTRSTQERLTFAKCLKRNFSDFSRGDHQIQIRRATKSKLAVLACHQEHHSCLHVLSLFLSSRCVTGASVLGIIAPFFLDVNAFVRARTPKVNELLSQRNDASRCFRSQAARTSSMFSPFSNAAIRPAIFLKPMRAVNVKGLSPFKLHHVAWQKTLRPSTTWPFPQKLI
jgi:hypothetical protein